MCSQLRRASSSIGTNLAEGCGRGSDSNFGRFVQIAMGSASEAEYQLLLAKDLQYLSSIDYDEHYEEITRIKRMLSSLLKTLHREPAEGLRLLPKADSRQPLPPMHIFLYEWITGGGLVEESGRLPASLLAEGTAMISALAADFAALDGCQVTAFRDMRLLEPSLPGCQVLEIHSFDHWKREFDRVAAAADYTLVVAPEFDGILLDAVDRIASANGRSLNAPRELVAVAASKQATAERLAAAGVAAPQGRIFPAEQEKLPKDFAYPAVLKPIDGAGSQHTLLLEGPHDEPVPYPWPRRLERFCPGRAASVALLCGPADSRPLAPCWQHQSSDGRFTYRGGAIIRETPLAQRAAKLAQQAVAALGEARGYIGVDLVLGDAADGSADVVIEVNPRLTTSYVGLRAAHSASLAQAIIDAAEGRPCLMEDDVEPIEFAATGETWLAGLAGSVAKKWR